ncbi:tyrosine-type recombinase/integrase [Peribacillus muralis]|uniref:tyrosine-type recombinase/integrase n=1 Tax=Peribacillus muralis TaxID=264697 RepID=UPI00366B9771
MLEIINTYLEEMKVTKAESTVKNFKATLNKFAKAVAAAEPAEVLPEDVMDFKKALLKNCAVGTANTQLKRIKAFLSWCVKQGMIELNPADAVKLVAEAEAVPKWLTKEQKAALLRAMNRDYLGINVTEARKSYREILMVMLMMKSGLRVGEICNLEWKDVHYSERKGTILVRSNKTEQHRTVAITSDTLTILKAYKAKHGTKGEYVFFSRQADKITERQVQIIVSKYQGLKTEVAEIEELTPHMLRHTFGHDLINGGMQLEAVARLMGHIKANGTPNIMQTIRYTKQSNTEVFGLQEDILAIN